MKWIDRILTSLSWIVVVATSADTILNGLKPIPILLGILLSVVCVSFYYLKTYYEKKPEHGSVILNSKGNPTSLLARHSSFALNANRVLLLLGCIGVVFTFAYYVSMPSLKMELSEVSNFETVQGNWKNIYTVPVLKDRF